jgi:HSP20 family molecular chaperone IbpA
MYNLIKPSSNLSKSFDWDFFDGFFNYPTFSNRHCCGLIPKIIKEGEQYKIIMPVPGLSKDDIKINVEDGYLNIEYEKEEKDDTKYFISSFSRSYKITNDIKEDEITGNIKDGVLEIKLPLSQKKPTQRLIEIT